MAKTPDVNDVLRKHGTDGVRGVHDNAKPYVSETGSAPHPNSARGDRNSAKGAKSRPPLEVIDAQQLLDATPPERSWHVWRHMPIDESARTPGLIPGNDVTLLGSDGGEGKTTLAIQAANATRFGLAWLEYQVRPGPAVYVTAEEPKDEIHIRLAKIMAPIVMSTAPHSLNFISLATADATLARFDNGTISPTDLFNDVARIVRDRQAKLLVLDAVADMFGGNENDRSQVRSFVGLLRGLAIECECAILLLAHPSVEGLKSGRGYSGSTHWHNAVRSRFYLTTPKVSDDTPDPDLRKLEHVKSNRGPRAKPIMLRWKDGYFAVDHAVSGDDHMAHIQAKVKFLELLAQFKAQGRDVSDKSGHAYAPKLFADDERAGGTPKQIFAKAMSSLFADKRLRVETRGPPSRPHRCIVEVPAQ
jgi:RecA-family ATPase